MGVQPDDFSDLHESRIATVIHHLQESGASSVLDLGCGDGWLLERLVVLSRLTRIVGIDLSPVAVAAARKRLGMEPGVSEGRIVVQRASFAEPDPELSGFDAAVLLETIEHTEPGRLSQVERAVFGTFRPVCVLVTTPNQEYNRLYGLPPGVFRHPEHRFEWTRTKFRHWACGVAERNGYVVTFGSIGEIDPVFGAPTQMARFILRVAG
jgi:3' terminal RNA ribose 2'-O-methyltransferase Hen1